MKSVHCTKIFALYEAYEHRRADVFEARIFGAPVAACFYLEGTSRARSEKNALFGNRVGAASSSNSPLRPLLSVMVVGAFRLDANQVTLGICPRSLAVCAS